MARSPNLPIPFVAQSRRISYSVSGLLSNTVLLMKLLWFLLRKRCCYLYFICDLVRPTKPLAWWEGGGHILGGRDGLAGGTWLACTRDGRVAFLTNVRELQSLPQPKSRGHLPVRFLEVDLFFTLWHFRTPFVFSIARVNWLSHTLHVLVLLLKWIEGNKKYCFDHSWDHITHGRRCYLVELQKYY